MNAVLAVDLSLGAILVGLALQVVIGRHLFRSIVFFVAFGLAMALSWARLGAPDLALADAAIGAGLTGALLMMAFRRLVEIDPSQQAATESRASPLAVVVGLLTGGLVATLGFTMLSIERTPAQAGLEVMQTLPELHLGNPISAVLLAFRGFDTLIEMTVLLAAFLGARVVARDGQRSLATVEGFNLPLVRTLVSVVGPLAALIAMHLVWIGADRPGGAFQAGSVLAAAGVLLLLTGKLLPDSGARVWIRVGLVLGVVGLASLVLVPMLGDRLPMAYLGRASLLVAEVSMMLSIAVTLSLLFAGSPSVRGAGS